nr:GNAT family N-acetyltransferase [Geodermatophilus saharensis]
MIYRQSIAPEGVSHPSDGLPCRRAPAPAQAVHRRRGGGGRGLGPPPPFDLYDSDPCSAALFLVRDADGAGYHPAVGRDGRVLAFAVVGPEAWVRGQEPAPGTVDVGMGVHPAATSRGLGTHLVGQVVDLARDLGATTAVRAAVAVFNERSLALCRSAGFRPVRDFPGPGDRPFRELVLVLDGSRRPATDPVPGGPGEH